MEKRSNMGVFKPAVVPSWSPLKRPIPVWICAECGAPVDLKQEPYADLAVYCGRTANGLAACTPRTDGLLLNDDQVRLEWINREGQ